MRRSPPRRSPTPGDRHCRGRRAELHAGVRWGMLRLRPRRASRPSGAYMTQLRIIKKYPNRRLYGTQISSYITLEDVRQLIIEREEFVVRDARSGADLTRQVLMQIIAEHEEHGEPIFSTELLTQVIRFRGDVLQGAMSSFLERSLGFFLEQQAQLR